MFGNLFGNLFGKNNLSLLELGRGYTFKFSGITWEILEIHNYSWKEYKKTTEYKLIGQNQEAYLEIEKEDGELYCSFSHEIDKSNISPEITESDFEGEDILGELDYNGNRYVLDEIDEGKYNNITNHESDQYLTTYTFINGNQFICIEQWEDNSLEFFAGEEISKKQITNINKGK